MSAKKHILVIGGGVIGRCAAYYAAERGHQVTLLDRQQPDHPGCSFGNAGFITPSHFVPLAAPGMVAMGLRWMLSPESPFYVKPRLNGGLLDWGWKFVRASSRTHVKRASPLLLRLNLASRACFEEIAQRTGNDFHLVRKGCLMLCYTRKRFEEEARVAEYARGLGLDMEVLSAEETAKREPNIRMNIVGAVYYPDDAHLIPDRFMASIRRLLEQRGVRCLWEREATGWRMNGDRVMGISTTDGDLTADEFVLCGGSWSPQLAQRLGVRLRMQAGKGYSLTLTRPRQIPSMPAIGTEGRLAVTPMGSSLRFGGTMEIAGMREDINPARIRGILKSVIRYYPDFRAEDFDGIEPWCGLRPLSPDGLPYVGRLTRFRNVSVGTGHAMMGLSLGPITGRLLAEVLSDERPSIEIEQLAPERYD